LNELKNMKEDELKELYKQREVEPVSAGENWQPEDTRYL